MVLDLTVRSGRVRRAKRLASRSFRAKTGEFLAEGPQAVREALEVADVVQEVFVTAAATQRHGELLAAASAAGVGWNVVGEDVLAEVADSITPQGVVAVCTSVIRPLSELPSHPRLSLICHDIRDPGNAGAVIRCADAAGAAAIIFSGDSVDPLNPKAVRASAGSLFHLPIFLAEQLADVRERLDGVRVLATTVDADHDLFSSELDLGAPTAWLMGNEAQGLPADLVADADQAVRVPLLGRAESLNLATAAAVCLYASAKEQRG